MRNTTMRIVVSPRRDKFSGMRKQTLVASGPKILWLPVTPLWKSESRQREW